MSIFCNKKIKGEPGLSLLAGALLSVFLQGCDPGFSTADEGDDDEEEISRSYLGAASTWQLSISESDNFELDVRPHPGGALNTEVTGRYEEFSSGFARLTVDRSTEGEPPTDTPLSALAVDEELLFVENWQNTTQLVPLVPGQECPATAFNANWIEWISPGSSVATNEETAFAGTLRFTPADAEVDIESHFGLTTDFPEQEAIDPLAIGTCDDGAARSNQVHTYFGNNRTALIHRNVGTGEESLWLALPATPTAAVDMDGNYIGFWVDDAQAGTGRRWYVTVECTNFSCEVSRITDIEDLSSVDGQQFNINLDDTTLDNLEEGFITGTTVITLANGPARSGQLLCIASEDFIGTANKVMACVGQSPHDIRFTVKGFFVAKD